MLITLNQYMMMVMTNVEFNIRNYSLHYCYEMFLTVDL